MMLLGVIVNFIALFVLILSTWLYKFFSVYNQLRFIPTTKLWPILGNALELLNSEDLLTYFPKLIKRLGSRTIRLHLGFRTYLITSDVKLFEAILGSSLHTYKAYTYLTPWLGGGLFVSSGKRWKQYRKLSSPAVNFKMLDNFINIFNSNGLIMVNKLRNQVDNSALDISSYVSLCALDIICETAMGISLNFQSNETSEYAQSIHEIMNIIHKRAVTPWYSYDFIYKWSQTYRQQEKHLKIIHSYTDKIINMRKQQLEAETLKKNQDQDVSNLDEFGRKKNIALLDHLLTSTIDGQPLSDKEVHDEVTGFMFGGHDTSACAINFILHLLANHSNIQNKVYQELCDIFGNNNETCSIADTNQMIYLEMVIKEALRLYPPALMFSRQLRENCQFDGMVIPKGTTVAFHVYSIQHDPEYFPNPEVFDPERFSADNYDASKKFAFSAFCAGPRNCAGQKFAMIEMKVLVSLILRHFELVPAVPKHELVLSTSMMLKSANGIKIGLIERK